MLKGEGDFSLDYRDMSLQSREAIIRDTGGKECYRVQCAFEWREGRYQIGDLSLLLNGQRVDILKRLHLPDTLPVYLSSYTRNDPQSDFAYAPDRWEVRVPFVQDAIDLEIVIHELSHAEQDTESLYRDARNFIGRSWWRTVEQFDRVVEILRMALPNLAQKEERNFTKARLKVLEGEAAEEEQKSILASLLVEHPEWEGTEHFAQANQPLRDRVQAIRMEASEILNVKEYEKQIHQFLERDAVRRTILFARSIEREYETDLFPSQKLTQEDQRSQHPYAWTNTQIDPNVVALAADRFEGLCQTGSWTPRDAREHFLASYEASSFLRNERRRESDQ